MNNNANFTEIEVASFIGQCASRIQPDWMLLTAGNPQNGPAAMTVSFGAFGFIWGKHFALVVVRHSRHTLPFILENNSFSLAFFDPTYRDQLCWCGRHSGKDFDKVAHCGFHTAYENDVPYFSESQSVLICKLMYKDDVVRENFVQKALYDEWYGSGVHKDDMHAILYASIDKVLERMPG